MDLRNARRVIALAFLSLASAASAANVAYDTAANTDYNSGWTNGSNGGFGFSAWAHSTTSGDGGQNGHFAGTGHSAFGRSWGMYANSGQTASTVRPFTGGSLSLNQTFSISIDNGNIQNGGTVGLGLQTSGGTNRLEFFFVGGGSDYRYLRNGVAGSSEGTGVAFTGNGLRIFVTPLNSSDARLRVTNATESSELFNQVLTLASAADIARARLFNANAGSGVAGSNDAFFDDVATPEPSSLALFALASCSLLRRGSRASRTSRNR